MLLQLLLEMILGIRMRMLGLLFSLIDYPSLNEVWMPLEPEIGNILEQLNVTPIPFFALRCSETSHKIKIYLLSLESVTLLSPDSVAILGRGLGTNPHPRSKKKGGGAP